MTKLLYEYGYNKVNPFLEDTLQHIEKGEKLVLVGTSNEMLIDKDTGEVKSHTVFAKRHKIDKAEFAKLYTSNLAAFFDLSRAGIKVFAYVVKVLKPNKDFFIFSYEDCSEYTGYKSKKSITDGIKELIENKFIARGQNPYVYFINPTIFFNGNRITFLHSFDVKSEDDLKSPKKISD